MLDLRPPPLSTVVIFRYTPRPARWRHLWWSLALIFNNRSLSVFILINNWYVTIMILNLLLLKLLFYCILMKSNDKKEFWQYMIDYIKWHVRNTLVFLFTYYYLFTYLLRNTLVFLFIKVTKNMVNFILIITSPKNLMPNIGSHSKGH